MLTTEEGRVLVEKTRDAIEAHLDHRRKFDPGPNDGTRLWKKRGVFVTITESGAKTLRGCIGSPQPDQPLIIEAVKAGILAATADPRFAPVTLEELRNKDCLELTVLSPLERIVAKTPKELKDSVVLGRDGIVVEGYGQRGLLLPQVAIEEDFDIEDFVTNCCLKAGLLPDVWLTSKATLYKFMGQVFAEDAPRGLIVERMLHNH
ncbi:MAG TPA: TIGR00296 family protein [Candidatus Binatus sp.]|nr:TIGR00296 family protein [Candidatus Binatus sp.]